MTYSYDAGTTTPLSGGLVEFGGIRLNDGTFKLTSLGELNGSPPVRVTPTPYPGDWGGTTSPPVYDLLAFSLTGYVDVGAVADLDPAIDQLRGAFNLNVSTAQTLVFNRLGFTTRRQVTAVIDGPLQIEDPVDLEKLVPQRNFTIPMIATDPIGYDADNSRTKDVPMTNVNTAVTSAGTAPVPFTAKFVGPFVNPTLTRVSDGAQITFTLTLAAGHYVTVDTHGLLTAVDDLAANQFGAIGTRTAMRIRPGTENWAATAASGTTGASKVTFTWRDGWL